MAYVVIPAYCPDRALISLVEQMWQTGCRIIVVDDGSGEEFQDIFEEISDVSVILRHPENRGKGAAIKSALQYIEQNHGHRDVVGIMDADGQHLPEDILAAELILLAVWIVNNPYKPEHQVSDGIFITEGLA